MYFKTIILKQSTISIRISSTSKIQNFLTIPIPREFIYIERTTYGTIWVHACETNPRLV